MGKKDYIGIASLVLTAIGLFFANEDRKENKKNTTFNLIGIIIGIISIAIMIWIFKPSAPNEEKFDIVNRYKDGTLHYTGNGTFENREDTWKWYSKDGVLVKIENYDDNVLDGEYKEFYSNGNIKISGKYNNGKRVKDTWKCFNLDGSQKECNL